MLFNYLRGAVEMILSRLGVAQFRMTEERPAEDNLGRLFYSITKTKTADGFLHFLQSRAKNAVIIAKVL